jgi:GTP diphosphokinase / guanosine-3',5'-bis(diphosphate) 3'-diphosphatase
MIRIEDILDKVSANYPQGNLDLLRRAYFFSAREHKGQTRASGEPYLVHPLEVANILAEMRLDEVSVATGLLHDVIEDTLVEPEVIKQYFGDEIAHLVEGLTKIAQLNSTRATSREEQQAENLRKMLLAMIDDVRVVLVKLADRLHNMRTLGFLKPEKRERIAQETLDIYAPIAHRLGMGKVRGELEDLAFQHLHPEDYRQLSTQLKERRASHEALLKTLTERLEGKMKESDVPFESIEGRVKRLYSIWKKLKRQRIELDQVYDLIALRIITPNEVRHCYAALGVIHNTWLPVPGRIKDWIATPRDNLYRALHTSVIGSEGQPFEVQIRTAEMNEIAEEGVAAHWKYKEGGRGARPDDEQALKALKRSLVEWTNDVKDSRAFLESLKLDLYPKDVYAFTPMGKVIQLPRGATPIDFAYAIHSEVGDTCTGARVNNRMTPLRTELQNGDVVEIITSPNAHPSRDWLNFVVTSRARNRVRHWVAEQQRAESVEIGRKLLEKEATRLHLSPKKVLNDSEFKRITGEYGYGRTEDLLAAVGYGKLVPRNVLAKYLGPERFAELDQKKESRLRSSVEAVKRLIRLGDDAIIVRGVDDLMVVRARCCSPIHGDEIIGYITRGKGVTVHARRCKNVESLMANPERIVEVDWASRPDSVAYAVKLLAITENRTGMIAGITSAISDMKTGIRDARASVSPDNRGRVEVTVEVFDLKHLDKVVRSVRNVPGVLDVERIQGAA